MKVFHMSGRSDDMWQTPSSTTSSFSVIEAYSVTVMLRSLEINLQPKSWQKCEIKCVQYFLALNIELNHFLARFNIKMNNQIVSSTPTTMILYLNPPTNQINLPQLIRSHKTGLNPPTITLFP